MVVAERFDARRWPRIRATAGISSGCVPIRCLRIWGAIQVAGTRFVHDTPLTQAKGSYFFRAAAVEQSHGRL